MTKPKEELRDKNLDSAIYDMMSEIAVDFKDLPPSESAMVVEAWNQLITAHTNAILQEVIDELPENKDLIATRDSLSYFTNEGFNQALSEVREILTNKMKG